MSSHTGPPKKKFKPNHHDHTDDVHVLAKIDSKTKQIDELLAGFDNPNNSLNFIPSSLNKTSIPSTSIPKPPPPTHKSHNEITKTITITATSFKIEHHTNTPPPPPPPPHNHNHNHTHPSPKKLRPLPSPNTKPLPSCLRKTTFTTFRDEKRNKRRSKSSKDTETDTNEEKNKNKNKKSRISFGKCVKNQDGVSAKFYSSPQYLIRDGTYLRPKPFQQIENEKRLLQMLGAPQELAGRALPAGLLDEDWEEIYDPQIPNDYSSFVIARQRLEEWIIMRKEQRNIAYQKAMLAAQYAQEYIDMEIKKEKEHEKSKRNRDRSHRDRYSGHKSSHRDRDRDRKRRSTRDRHDRSNSRSRGRDRDYHRRRSSKNQSTTNNNNNNKEYGFMGVLPTQSPLEGMHSNSLPCDGTNSNKNVKIKQQMENMNVKQQRLSGIDKAAKIMAKFGWKRGDGLGKSKQGLKGCLVPVGGIGGYNQLMSVQDPSNVLLLQNMAGKGQVDMDLKAETIEECKNFGPVLDCIVHETRRKNVAREQQVSVFVKFEYIESCMNALQTFNGRFFDGRRVVASFFPLERFDTGDLEI